jgi:hypothetical protein
VVRVRVTVCVASAPVLTTLPPASRICTTGWVAKGTETTVLAEGCVLNANWLAAPCVPVPVTPTLIVVASVLAFATLPE